MTPLVVLLVPALASAEVETAALQLPADIKALRIALNLSEFRAVIFFLIF